MNRLQPSDSGSLDELRSRLDALDDAVLDLLQQRNDVVRGVAAAKLASAVPVFVAAREDDKVERFRASAIRRGLDPDWAEDFLRMIMSSSRASQAVGRFPRASSTPRTLVLVGGYGGMGSLYGRTAEASGHFVRRLGRQDWDRAQEVLAGADAVIVTVPIRDTLEVIDRVAPLLRAETVLADFTSNKADVLARMLAAHGGPVVGLHPMHGPDVANLSKQLMVVCPGRDDVRCAWLLEQFALWGMRLKKVDAQRHDQAMHLVQGLRHFQALIHGAFLRGWGMAPEEILDYSSPIYRAELMMIGRIFAQDAELYADIVLSTDERRRVLLDFLGHLGKLRELVERDDKNAFIQEFREIAAYFGRFADRALTESGYLIHRLADRFA